jgi:hypothetical protein
LQARKECPTDVLFAAAAPVEDEVVQYREVDKEEEMPEVADEEVVSTAPPPVTASATPAGTPPLVLPLPVMTMSIVSTDAAVHLPLVIRRSLLRRRENIKTKDDLLDIEHLKQCK